MDGVPVAQQHHHGRRAGYCLYRVLGHGTSRAGDLFRHQRHTDGDGAARTGNEILRQNHLRHRGAHLCPRHSTADGWRHPSAERPAVHGRRDWRGLLRLWRRTRTLQQRLHGRHRHRGGHHQQIPRHLAGPRHPHLRHHHHLVQLFCASRLGARHLRLCGAHHHQFLH